MYTYINRHALSRSTATSRGEGRPCTSRTAGRLRAWGTWELHICVCVDIYVYIYVCVCVCLSLSLSLCIRIYIYIYIYTHTWHIYIYIYIYTWEIGESTPREVGTALIFVKCMCLVVVRYNHISSVFLIFCESDHGTCRIHRECEADNMQCKCTTQYMCIYIYIYIYTYVCMYTHTYTHTRIIHRQNIYTYIHIYTHIMYIFLTESAPSDSECAQRHNQDLKLEGSLFVRQPWHALKQSANPSWVAHKYTLWHNLVNTYAPVAAEILGIQI